MQQQIESAILSNVGNRLTQELAYGLIMTVMQVAQQAVEAAQAEAAARATGASEALDQQTMPAPGGAAQGPTGFDPCVDPAYARREEPAPAPPARRRQPSSSGTKKARR